MRSLARAGSTSLVEGQADAVDAVSLVRRCGEPLPLEHMAQVSITSCTQDIHTATVGVFLPADSARNAVKKRCAHDPAKTHEKKRKTPNNTSCPHGVAITAPPVALTHNSQQVARFSHLASRSRCRTWLTTCTGARHSRHSRTRRPHGACCTFLCPLAPCPSRAALGTGPHQR